MPQYVLQAVQDTVRLQCMTRMRACGAGLLTGETGGGGVDEAIFVRLVTHCLTTPTFLNLLLVQNVFCIS